MAAGEVLDLTRAALVLLLTIAGPLLVASLVTGVFIGLIQALTQVQEMTLTFVPKLLVMGVVLMMSLPLIGAALSDFMDQLVRHIVAG